MYVYVREGLSCAAAPPGEGVWNVNEVCQGNPLVLTVSSHISWICFCFIHEHINSNVSPCLFVSACVSIFFISTIWVCACPLRCMSRVLTEGLKGFTQKCIRVEMHKNDTADYQYECKPHEVTIDCPFSLMCSFHGCGA